MSTSVSCYEKFFEDFSSLEARAQAVRRGTRPGVHEVRPVFEVLPDHDEANCWLCRHQQDDHYEAMRWGPGDPVLA